MFLEMVVTPVLAFLSDFLIEGVTLMVTEGVTVTLGVTLVLSNVGMVSSRNLETMVGVGSGSLEVASV